MCRDFLLFVIGMCEQENNAYPVSPMLLENFVEEAAELMANQKIKYFGKSKTFV